MICYKDENDIFAIPGVQMDRADDDGSHCCLVGIGRLQVTSAPNCSDIMGNHTDEFISRITVDGKITFVDQRYGRKLIIIFFNIWVL